MIPEMTPREIKRAPNSIPMKPCPRGCGTRLHTYVETDGNGGTIEVLQECVQCRRSRIRIVPHGHTGHWCERCGKFFTRMRQRDRLPKFCPEHR